MAPKKKGNKQQQQQQSRPAVAAPAGGGIVHPKGSNAGNNPEQGALNYAQSLVNDNKKGRRGIKHEKSLTTDIGTMLHIAKAVGVATAAARRNARKNKKSSIKGTSTKIVERTTGTRRLAKRKAGGASVWITFKGGLSAVPLSGGDNDNSKSTTNTNNSNVSNNNGPSRGAIKKAEFRGHINEKKKIAAVVACDAYMQSAHEQVRSAGLVEEDGTPTEEGQQYLKEQEVEALAMLQTPLAGSRLVQLLGGGKYEKLTSIDNTSALSLEPQQRMLLRGSVTPPAFTSKEARNELEDALIKEREFLTQHSNNANGGACNGPMEFEVERQRLYYTLEQPTGLVPTADTITTNGNTMCIVRAKGPRNTKSTSLLYCHSQATTLQQRLIETLRREVHPLLQRDPEDGVTTVTATNNSNNNKKNSGGDMLETSGSRRGKKKH